ncbi:type I glyceraldehyde-3-phosphate dehydrogenase [Patescibacteria group bacterium]|nr:type I glyceraldehyde-3-phosphate dehydrogenase [Patescibacteria group bacterium]MBU4023122.1 type I glyceraldehyde-3-phosphate dehydrogenase [Patescibacteria group bacterium]MBU4078465.1 type I glyceraldehyde-3-phosphate dehydrogenase [Patescibacteria group bacterium]
MLKIAINGFGRIGRLTLRHILENHSNIEVVAINDLADKKTLLHLFKYDSSYGIYNKKVEAKFFCEPEPEKLPWKELGVDVVLECTGVFRDRQGAEKHLKAGAKKVILSAPAKSDDIKGYVIGVNEDSLGDDDIVDMGSCTTNCLAPVVKVLDENFGIKKGFVTTVHSYTNDQRILDLVHKDLRRARTAGMNMIPTTTGATKAICKIMPNMKGKLDGMAIRVPIATVSLIDLVCIVDKKTTVEKVNSVFKTVSQKELKNILTVEDEPLVSTDFKGNTYSAVIDSLSTKVNDNLVKVIAWYDNEYAYAARLAEFTEILGKQI